MFTAVQMKLQVDNKFRVFADGDNNLIGSGTHWPTTYTEDFKAGTKVVGIEAENVVCEFVESIIGAYDMYSNSKY